MMNLTDSLLNAISIIADKSAEEAFSDQTIKTIIKKVVSTSEGKYLVNYNHGEFYVYTQAGSNDVYQVDEEIYVLVPKGDMSQKKFIIGRTKSGEEKVSSDFISSSLLNDYATIGDNIVIEKTYGELNKQRMQPLKLNSHAQYSYYYCYIKDLNSYGNTLSVQGYDSKRYPCIDIDEESLKNSAKQAKALMIRAKFKASLDTESLGNYGIIVNVAFADETNPQVDSDGNTTYPPKLVAYILDISKMTGNPMKFYDYTSQYTITNFDGKNYLYIDSIIAFSEGFVKEDTASHGDDDDTNIYIDGLEIIPLDEVSSTSGDYKLRLITPSGNTIKEGRRDSLKINAVLTYLNKNITGDATFYWGVKDPSINSTSSNYHAKLGAGYRYIDISTDELIFSHNELTAAENVFTCVAVYESSIILRASVSLYNNNNKLEITIDSDQGTNFQFNEGTPTLTCLINGKTSNYQDYPDSAFSFVWSKEDAELGTIILDGTKAQLEKERDKELQECLNSDENISNAGRTAMEIISYYSTRISQVENISYPNGVHGSVIKCKLRDVNDYAIYSCSVYRGGIYVGYGSITLQNSRNVINNNYYITITNGDQVFQYDESGIAPNSEKQKEPAEILNLIAVFHSPQGAEVTPKRVRWIVPKGKTLINIPLLGTQVDAETGEKYYVGPIFPLSIKDVYDNTANDNQLTVIVTHSDGTEYRQTTNLLFTKIGEIGTNGTTTVLKISEDSSMNIPEDEYLTIIKEGENVRYNDSSSSSGSSTIALRTDLYTNNTKVAGHSTKWTIAGSNEDESRNYKINLSSNDNTCIISYNESAIDSKLDTRIIKAQASLQGKYISSFYGIPAIEYNEGYTYNDYPIRVLRNGTLRTVLYDSGGANPSYDINQGVHVELNNWINKTGYLNWKIESGPIDNGEYKYPNLFLAESPKSKTSSNSLEFNQGEIDKILSAMNTGKECLNTSTGNIKEYINNFLTDIEIIGIDNLLSTQSKITALWNRLGQFLSNTPDDQNPSIRATYSEYKNLFEEIRSEYDNYVKINRNYTNIYNKIQSIWNSEWPIVITSDRLHINKNSKIKDINQLIQKYQKVYDGRSNGEEIPVRSNIFDDAFINILSNIDSKYNNNNNSQQNILVEYTKILIAYIDLLIEETNKYLKSEFVPVEISNKYNFIYNNWIETISQNINNIIKESEEEFANIYTSIYRLYTYYQDLYLKVTKSQVEEKSETLNTWNAKLNGQDFNTLEQIYVIPAEFFNGLYMNNNVIGRVCIIENGKENEIAKVYVPIIMTLNTYELSSLNGWDGTNIEIGDDHILTPQVGAGIKDDTTNTFSGMVMGVVSSTKSLSEESTTEKSKENDKIGLIGYSNGVQSVFIDSRTGSATFGLPEEDTGSSEARIELNPRGVSKIGNWKIGSRFLYNIVGGSYENRRDIDHPNELEKMMIPHDKYGIILSSDKPYIHVKGENYGKTNVKGINYQDEYNNINPGDSLELRMDPSNKSLFSIVQHTVGFGDENIDDLFFGYKASESNNIITVKDYIANENIQGFTSQKGIRYFIYKMITNGEGKYLPYYVEDNTQAEEFNLDQINILQNETKLLSSVLDEEKFKRIYITRSIAPVFNINSENGIVSYDPNCLIWKNSKIGLSNNNGWQSITEKARFDEDDFSIDFKYTENKTEEIEKDNLITSITLTSTVNRLKLVIDDLRLNLDNINLYNSSNIYVQFYIITKDSSSIENSILQSEQINLKENQNKIEIELFFKNPEENLLAGKYDLRMKLYVKNFMINSNCSCNMKRIHTDYLAPAEAPYGTIEITDLPSEYQENYIQSTGGFRGTVGVKYYKVRNNSGWSGPYDRFYFKIDRSDDQVYDFILWRRYEKDDSSDSERIILGGGRTITKNNSEDCVFVSSTAHPLEELNPCFYFDDSSSGYPYYPSRAYPWRISFYPKGYCVNEIVEDNIVKYQLVNEFYNGVIERTFYTGIDFKENENYEDKKVSWSFSIENIQGKIVGLIPEDNTKFCITRNNGISNFQGVPFSETYWEKNNDDKEIQKIKFYSNYFQWVNSPINGKKQYGYIDIIENENDNVYYKYIKTLKRNYIDDKFKAATKDSTNKIIIKNEDEEEFYVFSEIEDSKDNFEKEGKLYWKEFIRVGLDDNGRFFSAGLQDKKTYSHTGKIYSFGKIPGLYGQEIRTQKNNINTYTPIIKIFSQTTESNTTYITQGQNDDGNISIRTSGNNHYIELAASQFSTDNMNLIPTTSTYVKIGYNSGVEIKSDISKIELLKEKLTIGIDNILIKSNNTEGIFRYEMTNNGYTWVKSPFYVVSSIPESSSGTAYSKPLGSSDNEVNEHYRIKASSDGVNPLIQLQVGKNNVGLNIDVNKVELKSIRGRFIQIAANNESSFTIDKMKLEFKPFTDEKVDTITLSNNRTKIEMRPDNISIRSGIFGSSTLEVSDSIVIKGNKGLIVEENLYSTKNIHVGYDIKNGVLKNKKGIIYLYHGDKENPTKPYPYVKIQASDLERLFDWYNKYRWAIARSGNTLAFKKVGKLSEGRYDNENKTWEWNILKFNESYTGSMW